MSHRSELLSDQPGRARLSARRWRRKAGYLFKRWRRDESGVAAVEFGLIAVPFFALVLGIIALGFRFFVAQGLEAGLAEGARRVMTGQVQANAEIASVTDFRDKILCKPGARLVPDFIDCSQLVIDIRTITSFGAGGGYGVRPSDFLLSGGGTFNIGAAGQIVVARAAYPLPAIASALTGGGTVEIGGKEYYALMAAAVFRNEPFGAGGAAP
jgi:hypothetical protein